jgi:TATA-binding protein-associated factor
MACRLGDRDDDVRSVAASCLIPVATHLVRQLPTCLSLVLTVLWACLGDMKDDLSSSVGAVMDLLGGYFLLSQKPKILTTFRETCFVR